MAENATDVWTVLKEDAVWKRIAEEDEILEFLTEVLRGDIEAAGTRESMKAAELML